MKKAGALLLTPGAGAGRDQSTLVAIDKALTAAGWAVDRWDFPYRRAGRKSPDRPPVLIESVREGAGVLLARSGARASRLFLGGRSMGGRMCSMAAAEGLDCGGLVLISYPLHPPGKPEQLRVDHFPKLDIPCLFVSGTRDTFGKPDELTSRTSAIPGPVTHLWIDGGDHGLKGKDRLVVDAVVEWLRSV